MKKNLIILLVVLLCICFFGCNGNENTDIATNLSETETKTEIKMETETETETDSSQTASANVSVKTEKKEIDFEPNYGIYCSLIDAYIATAYETYDGNLSYISEDLYEYFEQDKVNYRGSPCFKLIDFDGNGVLELVVTALNITNPESLWAVTYEKAVTKVFTLTSENELVFVDDFTLFREEGYHKIPYLSFVTIEVDGETYIITGNTDEYNPTVNYTIWKYNDAGFDFLTSLYANIDTDTFNYINAVIDGKDVSDEEAKEFLVKWISESTFSTFIGGDEEFIEKNIDKPMNDAWQFLSDYETVEGNFDVFVDEELELTPEMNTESFDHINGTWSIDGSNDTAYVEILDGNYVSYYPTGTVESYASFAYDGIFSGLYRYSLYLEGEFTGSQFYYINEDTIMLQNGYGEWTTFHRK